MIKKNKLRSKMVEYGLNAEKIAAIIGINPATFYRKCAGNSEFTRPEIQAISTALHLSAEEKDDIFFASELA